MSDISAVHIKDGKADLKHLFLDWNAKQKDLKVLKYRFPQIGQIIDQIVLKSWMGGAQLGANVQAKLDQQMMVAADKRIKELIDFMKRFGTLCELLRNAKKKDYPRSKIEMCYLEEAFGLLDDIEKEINNVSKQADSDVRQVPQDNREGPDSEHDSIIETP